jgi:Ca2+-binding RTX toxin-like protein
MSQINNLVTFVRAATGSAGSTIGVSAANANLAAAAGVLYSMQISGYEIIDPQMFVNIEDLASDLQSTFDNIEDLGQGVAARNYSPATDSFLNLIDSSAILGSDDFVLEQTVPMQLADDQFNFSELILSDDDLFDQSQPMVYGDELVNSYSEKDLSIEEPPTADLASENLDTKDFQSSLPKAASSPFSNNSFSSLLTGSVISSGASVNPDGLVLQSAGSGDVVYGSGYADTLLGSSSGGDTLAGGGGSDIYAVYNSTTSISEINSEGSQDTAFIAVNNYFGTNGIERVVVLDGDAYSDHAESSGPYLSGLDSGWKINGSSDAQTITGSYGGDILSGGGGEDVLIGGLGDDVYFYTGSESVIEGADSGRDIVISLSTVTLSANIEVGVAESQSSDLDITGNNLDNLLVGNSSTNTLSGGLGADTLVGNGGDDVLIGGAGSDVYILNGEGNYLGEISDFRSGEDRIFISHSNPSITLSIAPEDGFTGIAGEVMVDAGTLQFDWNGDFQADALLIINEAPLLSDLFFIDPNQIAYF